MARNALHAALVLDTVVIAESAPASSEDILSPSALVFLADLTRTFRARIAALRSAAAEDERPTSNGRVEMRGEWSCAPLPAALGGPRVDLVGAVDTASITSALSSHATAFIADLDDAMLPSWRDLLGGQALLRNVTRRARPRVKHEAQATMPPVFLRPRPLWDDEAHLFVDAEPVPAGLLDVGLYCFHNGAILGERGEGPWLSLTKLRGRTEARLWADIATWIERELGLRPASIQVSLRVDTVRALDELEPMLWTLRSRAISVACGRYELVRDYIAAASEEAKEPVTPARGFLTVDRPPLASAASRIVEVCRRRGAQPLGPTLAKTGGSRIAFAQLYADAGRQARLGFDGTRVVDSDLVPIARAAFAAISCAGDVLLPLGRGERRQRPAPPLCEAAVRENIEVALIHLSAAFEGQSRVRLDSYLEDCASARTARAQLWEWVHARASLSASARLDRGRFRRLVLEESRRLASPARARAVLEHICMAETFSLLAEREEHLRRDLAVGPPP